MGCVSASFAAHAAELTGVVTNKTTNKPSAGDTVALIDVQAGMAQAATTTTDSSGHYRLSATDGGTFLIRVTHQGASYFIAAPAGGASGDVVVYDSAEHLDSVGIDADMLLIEAAGGVLRVTERYLIRNSGLPPRAQFSAKGFEIAIPEAADLDGASATRPGGMGTVTQLTPLAQKGHYSFNVPIQPSQGEKETLFEVQYHIAYSGQYTFAPHLLMPADHLVVYVAKGIEFSNAQGASFQSAQEDPRVQTFVARNVQAGQQVRFTVSGEGQMTRDAQSGMSGADRGGLSSGPGGGIGAPIATPDPLTRYKGWILSGLAACLAVAAWFLLRRRPGPSGTPVHSAPQEQVASSAPRATDRSRNEPSGPPGSSQLQQTIKDELFAIESEKLTGTLSQEEYLAVRTGLEALLKRELGRHERR